MEEIERVKYENQPLVEVIYQVRFPTILLINAKDPVEFQEEIKVEFPFYRKIIEDNEMLIDKIRQPIARNNNHEFISKDQKKKINVTSTFLSISSLSYEKWEDFRELIKRICFSFEKIYSPQFYIRVGLRYTDVIDREKLGLEAKGWTDLIKPNILGIIDKTNQSLIKQWSVNNEYVYDDYGITTKQKFFLANKNENNSQVMIFDCDYYKLGNISLNEVEDLSNRLHEKSSYFLRNAITNELHKAMKPHKL